LTNLVDLDGLAGSWSGTDIDSLGDDVTNGGWRSLSRSLLGGFGLSSLLGSWILNLGGFRANSAFGGLVDLLRGLGLLELLGALLDGTGSSADDLGESALLLRLLSLGLALGSLSGSRGLDSGFGDGWGFLSRSNSLLLGSFNRSLSGSLGGSNRSLLGLLLGLLVPGTKVQERAAAALFDVSRESRRLAVGLWNLGRSIGDSLSGSGLSRGLDGGRRNFRSRLSRSSLGGGSSREDILGLLLSRRAAEALDEVVDEARTTAAGLLPLGWLSGLFLGSLLGDWGSSSLSDGGDLGRSLSNSCISIRS
jgi:hypothetical protein